MPVRRTFPSMVGDNLPFLVGLLQIQILEEVEQQPLTSGLAMLRDEGVKTPFAICRVLDAVECLADETPAPDTVVKGSASCFRTSGSTASG